MSARHLIVAAAALALVACSPEPPPRFTEVAQEVGLRHEHRVADRVPMVVAFSGGLAAGDYDADGDVDLYAAGGPEGRDALFDNTGEGSFERTGGPRIEGQARSGALWLDADRDGQLELLVGGVDGWAPRLFDRTAEGGFRERAVDTVLDGFEPGPRANTWSAAAADYDRDGDLDLYVARWSPRVVEGSPGQLWSNDGDGRFRDASTEAGLTPLYHGGADHTLAPTFADIDADGWPDLLVAADFASSKVLRNRHDGTFEDATTDEISDENGMGSAVGDFDGDGVLDWFVTSIWAEPGTVEAGWGTSGNRLYRGLGGGRFEDATEAAGVRHGGWGWAACSADFDNDGDLDIYHVNGVDFRRISDAPPLGGAFAQDAARMFVNRGDGTFVERAKELGVDDDGLGRAVACFDYDRDGDVDIAVQNSDDRLRLYRNDLEHGPDRQWTTVRLRGPAGNPRGIGARITVRAGGRTQVREVRAGNNFVSQQPAEAHFGLASASRVDSVEVRWPDGTSGARHDLEPGALVWLSHPGG